jgi:hypothetical protein
MGALDYPAHLAQAATMRLATPGNGRWNAGCVQRPTIFIVIVSAIGVDPTGFAKRSARHAANWWNRFDQRQQLRDVVAICARQDDRDRRAVGVGGDVVFGAGSRTIRGVRACFSPAPTARTEEESMTTREKSMRSAARSFASRISCSRSHTPACCQSRKRRQQLMPEPHPISAGNSFQRIPVLSTNRMPVSAARSGTRRRPGYRKRLGFAGGSSGSISVHNSSSMIDLPISSIRSSQRSKLTGLARG